MPSGTDAAVAGDVDGDGVQVGEVHLRGVGQLAELEGGGGARRHEDHVDLLVGALVICRDERTGLLRSVVVLVVHARAQQVGAEHLTALGLGAEPVRAALGALLGERGASGLLIAVPHAVKAGQVGERLGRADYVIGGDGGIQVRQVDLNKLRALLLKRARRRLDRGLDLEGQPRRIHERGNDAHAQALDAVVHMRGKAALDVLARAVERVAPARGERIEREGDVLDRAKGPTWSSDEPNATTP